MNNTITSISDRLFDRKISRFIKEGKYQQARNLLHQRNNSRQDDLWLLTSLAVLYYWKGETDQVLSIAHQIESYPYTNEDEYALARWRISLVLQNMGLYEDAIGQLSFCVDYWPDNVRVLALNASMQLEGHQFNIAMKSFKRVLELDDKNQDAVLAMVDLYWEMGEGDRAYEFIKGYLEKYPDFAPAHFLLAMHIYNVQGDPRASLPHFEKALYLNLNTRLSRKIAKDHNRPQLYERVIGWYINALLDCGLNKAAKAMNQDFHSGDLFRSSRSYYFREIEDWDSAIKWAKKGLQKSPEFHNLRFSLGVLYIKIGLYEDAERELLEALRVAEKNYDVAPERTAALIVLYRILENNEKEKEYLETSLSLDAEITYLILARHFNDLEFREEALVAAEHAIEQNPEWIFALYELARAQIGSGKHQNGIETYKKLILNQPNNGKLWLGVAQGYTNLGEEKKALEAVEKALSTKNLSSIKTVKAIGLQDKLESALDKE